MRSRTPVTPDIDRAAAPAAKKTDTRRRRFLLALGAGGAGAATAAVTAAPAALASPDNAAPDAKPAGYRETEHVRSYYRTARM